MALMAKHTDEVRILCDRVRKRYNGTALFRERNEDREAMIRGGHITISERLDDRLGQPDGIEVAIKVVF